MQMLGVTRNDAAMPGDSRFGRYYLGLSPFSYRFRLCLFSLPCLVAPKDPRRWSTRACAVRLGQEFCTEQADSVC